MSAMGLRQKAVVAVLVVIVLYAVAVGTWFMHSERAWKMAQRRYDEAKKTCERERKLIGEKSKWESAYQEEKAQMPTFDEGKSTDTAWMRKMEDIAQRNLILLGQHQAEAEIDADDVKELPVKVSGCEGSLEALVRFMHELENTDDGMFSITQLRAKPSRKQGYLNIDFTLNCAYMREK